MMAKLPDAERDLLLRILRDSASNVVEFTRTADGWGHRRDEGLAPLLPAEVPLSEKRELLKEAMIGFLEAGGNPGMERAGGDRQFQIDAGRVFQFRIAVLGERRFVKLTVDEADPDDPTATVVSVKRDDRAWS